MPPWPRKPNSGLIDGMALPRGQTLKRWCLCWHFKPSFHDLMTELLEALKMTSCQSCNIILKILGPLKHGLMANKPNCNIPPLAMYSGQTTGGRGHEFGKWTCFLFSPSLLLLFPSQYGDIISLTVSTQVHLVIHIIKETKTTDVFLNLEVCIKTCLLLCMFLCCREVENVQSHHCLWADLKLTCYGNTIWGYQCQSHCWRQPTMCLCQEINFEVSDHVLGCRLDTTWHKMGPRTKGICSLNTYFYQWQLQVMSPNVLQTSCALFVNPIL